MVDQKACWIERKQTIFFKKQQGLPCSPVFLLIPDENSCLKWITFTSNKHFDSICSPFKCVDIEISYCIIDNYGITWMILLHMIVTLSVYCGMNSWWIVTHLFHQIDFTIVWPVSTTICLFYWQLILAKDENQAYICWLEKNKTDHP